VPSDVTLVDRDFDGFADHAYVADTRATSTASTSSIRLDHPRTAARLDDQPIGYTPGRTASSCSRRRCCRAAASMFVTNPRATASGR
jgi:hypothetical protein